MTRTGSLSDPNDDFPEVASRFQAAERGGRFLERKDLIDNRAERRRAERSIHVDEHAPASHVNPVNV